MRIAAVAIFLLGSAFASASPVAGESSIATAQHPDPVRVGYEIIKESESTIQGLADDRRGPAIDDAYVRSGFGELTPGSRFAMSNDQAKLVFQGANIAAFYTLRPKYVGAMRLAIAELERRAVASRQDISDFYRALVSIRDFDSALAFRTMHPNAGLPALDYSQSGLLETGEKQASELLVTSKGAGLFRRPLQVGPSTVVFVVGHPLCHFTQNAAIDIAGDTALAAFFRQHSKWLAPQNRDVDFGSFTAWNENHAGMGMTIAFDRKEWPLFKIWATPVFYFVKDGSLVDTVVGWPNEGQKAKLFDAMEKVGYRVDVARGEAAMP